MVLATLGKRETDPRGLTDLAQNERAPVRRQALGVAVRAALIGLAGALIGLLI